MSNIHEQFFDLGAIASGGKPPEGSTKPVTVRLDPHLVCEIDALASVTGMSRQALLTRLIAGGLKEAVAGFLEGADDQTARDFDVYIDRCQRELED
jgi:predicted transcriptional regulator